MIDWPTFSAEYEERKARHEAGVCVNGCGREVSHGDYACEGWQDENSDCPGWPWLTKDREFRAPRRDVCSYCGLDWKGPDKRRGDHGFGGPLEPVALVLTCYRCDARGITGYPPWPTEPIDPATFVEDDGQRRLL